MAGPSTLTLAQRWLVRARRGWCGIQAVTLVAAEAGTDLHLHPPLLMALLVGLAAVDVAEHVYVARRGVAFSVVVAHAAVDLSALTGVLALTGGVHNPLISVYLLYVALLALVLRPRDAWLATTAAMLLQGVVVWAVPAHALPRGHLVGHVAAFDLAAIAITWVVGTLSAAVARSERERATTDRLAALGTLAAGVAHELGTPLGTLQLLAEELRRGPVAAGHAEALLTELGRCRSLLDRLRGREPETHACTPDLSRWVAEWRRAAPDVEVEVAAVGIDGVRVAGAAESWRGALWSALDNARRAGAHRVRVHGQLSDETVDVRVVDDGRGIAEADADRAIEPFRSGWGSTGLGLFVARSFALSAGGDVALAPDPGGGATTSLRMRRLA